MADENGESTSGMMKDYVSQAEAQQRMAWRILQWELEWQKYLMSLEQAAATSRREDIRLQFEAARLKFQAEQQKIEQHRELRSIQKEVREMITSAMERVSEEQQEASQRSFELMREFRMAQTQRSIAAEKLFQVRQATVTTIDPDAKGSIDFFMGQLNQYGPTTTLDLFLRRVWGKDIPKNPKTDNVLMELARRYFAEKQLGTSHEVIMKDVVEPGLMEFTKPKDFSKDLENATREYEQAAGYANGVLEEFTETKKLKEMNPETYQERVLAQVEFITKATQSILGGNPGPGRAGYAPDEESGPTNQGVIAGYYPNGKPMVIDPAQWGGSVTSSDGTVYLVPAKGASFDTMIAIEEFNKTAGKGKKVLQFPGKAFNGATAPAEPPPASPGGPTPLSNTRAALPEPKTLANGMQFGVKEGHAIFQSPAGTWVVNPKTKVATFYGPDGASHGTTKVNQDPFLNPEATGEGLQRRMKPTNPASQTPEEGFTPQQQYEMNGQLAAIIKQYKGQFDQMARNSKAVMATPVAGSGSGKQVPLGPSRINMLLMAKAQEIGEKHNIEPAKVYYYMADYLADNHQDSFMLFDMPHDMDEKGADQLVRQIQAFDRAWGSGMPDGYYLDSTGRSDSSTGFGGTGFQDSAAKFPRLAQGPKVGQPGPIPILPYFTPELLTKFGYKSKFDQQGQ